MKSERKPSLYLPAKMLDEIAAKLAGSIVHRCPGSPSGAWKEVARQALAQIEAERRALNRASLTAKGPVGGREQSQVAGTESRCRDDTPHRS